MIDREELGKVSEYGHWPTASIPQPVEDYFWKLVRRLPSDIVVNQVGQGYHNQGWNYIEVEFQAISFTKATEKMDEIYWLVMCEFQEQ